MNRKSILAFIVILAASLFSTAAAETPPAPAAPQTETELSDAFFRRIEQDSSGSLLTFDLFHPELDAAFLSPTVTLPPVSGAADGNDTADIEHEPGFWWRSNRRGWQVKLPGDPGWDESWHRCQRDAAVELSLAPENVETTAVTKP